MSAKSAAAPRKIRWWPAAVIVAVAAAYLARVWLGAARHTQDRVVMTFPALFFGVLLLLVWLCLFSRLPGRTRRRIFVVSLVVAAAGMGLFRIEGVSGNFVPIVSPRWSGARDFGAAAAAAAGVTAPGPNDYPQFLGPRRDGRLDGPRLARDWQARPPRELWRHEVGEGWSSFAVVGEAAVTQELRGDDEVVVRYELTTGKTVWTHAYPAPFRTTIAGNGPRATPTIADGRVYAVGATGVLSVLDLDDGEVVWTHDLSAGVPQWGKSTSPLVVGETVVVPAGSAEGSLVAYDRETGEVVWAAGDDRPAYSSPHLATLAGVEQVLMFNAASFTGHDAATGEVLWRVEWKGGEHTTQPLPLGGDRVLTSAGYGMGSRLYEISRRDGDTFAVTEVWSSPRLKSKFANMVLRDGTIYGLDDGVLVAIDPASGERRWKSGRYGHGQLVLVGDLLLIQAENGEIVLVEASPEEHRELARLAALSGKTWNPPVLSGGYLLVRNNREAACYELAVEG